MALSASGHGKRWMRAKRGLANLVFLPARTTLMPQPRGVVGIIVPWNYPLYLAVGPLIDAITAGNRVMLKPLLKTCAAFAKKCVLRGALAEIVAALPRQIAAGS